MIVSVADVMSERVIAVRQSARFTEIKAAMRRFQLMALPVIDTADRVVGMVCQDDPAFREAGRRRSGGLLGLLGRLRVRPRPAEATAAELMSSPVVTVTPSTAAREAARVMYRHQTRQLPVIDPANGRLTGIVTRSDLLAVYERPDEEIRREILYDIIGNTLGMDPEHFIVSVVGGTVLIRGQVERRSEAVRLAEAIGHVDGVAAVGDHMVYRRDDRAPEEHRAKSPRARF